MAREPELSIRVNVDPTIDRDVFQQKINALIPESKPIKINGEIDAAKALKSIGDYQKGNQHLVPILATISNAQAAIDAAFKDTDIPVNITIGAQGLSAIKTQLQGIIDSLDYSKIKLPNKTQNGNNSNPSIDVTLNVTQQALDDLKVNVEKNIKAIDVPLDITQTTLDNIKTKIENALNQIQFNPNPQVKNPPPGGGGGGGGNSQTSKERALVRNLIEQAQIGNKRDTANKNKRYRNASVQNSRINDLQMTESSLRSDISKTNPNYQNKDWYYQATQKAKYIKDDHDSLQKDKEDLDIVQKLNAELDKNVELRRELSKIDQNRSPIEYQVKEKEISDSNYQVRKLGQQVHKTGVSLSNIRNLHVDQLKILDEQIKNEILDEYDKAINELRVNGNRYKNSIGKDNKIITNGYLNEYDKSKNNLFELDTKITNAGLSRSQAYYDLYQKRQNVENGLTEAIKERVNAQQKAIEVDDKDIRNVGAITARLERYKQIFENSDSGIASSDYTFVSDIARKSNDLYSTLDENVGADKNQLAQNWAQK